MCVYIYVYVYLHMFMATCTTAFVRVCQCLHVFMYVAAHPCVEPLQKGKCFPTVFVMSQSVDISDSSGQVSN